jgi:hypothetical protein
MTHADGFAGKQKLAACHWSLLAVASDLKNRETACRRPRRSKQQLYVVDSRAHNGFNRANSQETSEICSEIGRFCGRSAGRTLPTTFVTPLQFR